MKTLDAIENRRSIRNFSDKKVRWDYVLEAIDAALQAPFAGNINHLQFMIVENQETKNTLAIHAQQEWLADAPVIILVCSDSKHLISLYQDRGHIYAKQQTGAAIQNFLLRITDLKLSSCWVGAFTEEHIKRDLGIPKNIEIEAILPVGYPEKNKKIKIPRKKSLESSIHWGKWGIRQKPTRARDPQT